MLETQTKRSFNQHEFTENVKKPLPSEQLVQLATQEMSNDTVHAIGIVKRTDKKLPRIDFSSLLPRTSTSQPNETSRMSTKRMWIGPSRTNIDLKLVSRELPTNLASNGTQKCNLGTNTYRTRIGYERSKRKDFTSEKSLEEFYKILGWDTKPTWYAGKVS